MAIGRKKKENKNIIPPRLNLKCPPIRNKMVSSTVQLLNWDRSLHLRILIALFHSCMSL